MRYAKPYNHEIYANADKQGHLSMVKCAPQTDRIAEILGRVLGPQDGNSEWSPHYTPRWPDDYSAEERAILRSAAEAVLSHINGEKGDQS